MKETDLLIEISGETADQLFDGGDAFWLLRLSRLVRLSPTSSGGFDATKLVRLAIYSTYLDCREAGLEDLARQILIGQRAA